MRLNAKDFGIVKEAVITGVPMLVFMATNFVKALGLNTIIMNQIGEDGMAVFTVCDNVLLIVEMLTGGIIGVIPNVAGILFGEKDYVGIRVLCKKMLKYSYIVLAVIFVLIMLFTEQITIMFGGGGELGREMVHALRIFALCVVPYLWNKFTVSYYESIEETAIASFVTFLENAVAVLPATFIGISIWKQIDEIGTNGIGAAFVATEIITLIAAWIFRKIKHKNSTFYIVPDQNPGINFDFSIKSTMEEAGAVNRKILEFCKENGVSGTTGVFRTVQRVSPLLPVKWKEQNEKGEWVDTDHYAYTSLMNPVDIAYNSGYNKRNSRTFNGQVNASLKIIEGLYLNGQYAANYYTRDTKKYVPAMNRWMSDGTEDPGNKLRKNSISESHINTLTQTLNATATYQKNINLHDFKLLGGFSQEWAHTNTLSAGRKVLLLDGIEVIDAGTDEITNGGSAEEWALRSFFGRINYNYDEKYLLEANVRYDGTSRFAKDNRWGCFPSFSAGWNFSKEKFMSFADPVLQMAKLRASWGELGNQNVGDNFYPYLVAIESVDKAYPIGNQLNTGFQQIALGNKNIKWETIRMLNIGVDFALFNNRLTVSADWFKKNNMDALVRPSFPLVIGKWQKDSSRDYLPLENLGEVESRGWEINLAWRDQIGQVKYRAFFNLSDARNKIIDLGSSAPVLGDQIRRVGDPIDAYYGYRTDGLAQVDDFEGKDSFGNYVNPKFPVIQDGVAVQPGDIKYKDISGPDGKPDGIIDDYDKEIIGDKTPRYSYSFKGELEWKGIDFSFYLQGVGKANGYLSEEARHCFINDYSVPKKSHLDRWTPENPNASYPRMYYAQTHNRRFSDFWIENAAYLRLKNVQLGYTFPQKWMRKFGINRLRAYVSADNLFTVTKYFDGFDPEVQQSSGDTYPQVRTYVFGLNLTF